MNLTNRARTRFGTIVVKGPNGAGKTTLLREFVASGNVVHSKQIANQLQVNDEVWFPLKMNRRTWEHARASEVSAYVDPLPVSRDLTVQEHAHMVADSWFGNTQTATETAEKALEIFRIAHLKDRLPHQMSLGQSQLFNLALAFARPANVIVLDEPERHLDTEHTAILASIIKDRANQGTAFLIASHDPEISAVANTIIELRPT